MNRRAIMACALALAFAAMSGKAALAQDRGRSGRDRRPDSTGARPETGARPDTTPEAANGADAQGGHVTSDADRAVIQADQERKARQAEADRQAAQGRRPDDQGRQQGGQGRQPGYDQGRQGTQGWPGREAPNGADWQGRHTFSEADRQVIEFNSRDRQVTRDWYRQNQRRLGPGWRYEDRLPPYMQRRLRRGYRLDPQMRRELHSLPPELSWRYGPAPRGYRYAVIGGNIVLLDDWYEVHDVFSLTLTF